MCIMGELLKIFYSVCFFTSYIIFISVGETESIFDRPSTAGCILPTHPKFGNWYIRHSFPNDFTPGLLVPENTILEINCAESYTLNGCKFIFCEDAKWVSEFGRCIKTCPPRLSTATMNVTCTYQKKELLNCTNAVDGTRAKFKCINRYKIEPSGKSLVHICKNGEWDQEEPRCVADCGQRSNKTSNDKNISPWHIAIAKNSILTCSGTLVSRKLVLTAAQCITDMNANLLPKENFTLAVGKYYRRFDDRDTNNIQLSKVHAMFIPRQYKGELQNYLGDIAIVVAENAFTLTPEIKPVCLDLSETPSGYYGYVSSWNFFGKNTNRSDVLKEVQVNTIATKQCERLLGEDLIEFLTDDKICVNYTNVGKLSQVSDDQ